MAEKKSVVEKSSVSGPAIRKIQQQANGSTTIVLPPDLLRELKWRDKQKVILKRRNDTIVISDSKIGKKKAN
ncbi:MAG: hypothetical protein KBD21_04405 [Candidatus Pacebacteria bacterium]|nr:hypothetical protein [Candidatus Paceibacterota bacterium]